MLKQKSFFPIIISAQYMNYVNILRECHTHIYYDSISESKRLQHAIGGLEPHHCFTMVMNIFSFSLDIATLLAFLSIFLRLFYLSSFSSSQLFFSMHLFIASFFRSPSLFSSFLFSLENRPYVHILKNSLVLVLFCPFSVLKK